MRGRLQCNAIYGWDWDGMHGWIVFTGHRSSKRTFCANNFWRIIHKLWVNDWLPHGESCNFFGKNLSLLWGHDYTLRWPLNTSSNSQKNHGSDSPPSPLAMAGRGIHAHKRNVPSVSRSKAVQSERLTWISLLGVKSFKSVFITTNLCAAFR